jgi:valyl-tRNA synthetase
MVERLASLSELRILQERPAATGGAVRSAAKFDLRMAAMEKVDVQADLNRLRKEHERLWRDIQGKQNKLADETFRSKAPAQIVQQMEATLSQRRVELEKITARLAQLGADGASYAAE